MAERTDEIRQRLAGLSPRARHLLDYVAAVEGGARYAVLRHLSRLPEPDMVQVLREVVGAGLLAAAPGEPDTYDFTDEDAREVVLAEAGQERLSKLRTRADAARGPTDGPDIA